MGKGSGEGGDRETSLGTRNTCKIPGSGGCGDADK